MSKESLVYNIRLLTGENILCGIDSIDIEHYIITNPVQMRFEPLNKMVYGEAWLTHANGNSVLIKKNMVVFAYQANDNATTFYNSLLKHDQIIDDNNQINAAATHISTNTIN